MIKCRKCDHEFYDATSDNFLLAHLKKHEDDDKIKENFQREVQRDEE